MKLLPLDRPELLEGVASWLARKENHQWLDFGNGRQIVTPALLRIMAQRETHFLRAFTSDQDDVPVGIVGLTPNPADANQETTYVRSQNPAEHHGPNTNSGNVAGSNFTTCTLPF